MNILDFDITWVHSGSKENQDLFAYMVRSLFYENQNPGTYLDIGCYHPFLWNNTFSLEKTLWTGLLFDASDEHIELCKTKRTAKSFCCDVSTEEFSEILNKIPEDEKHFNYVSIDADDASVDALKRMLESGVTFDSLTFEHAYGVESSSSDLRMKSRSILKRN